MREKKTQKEGKPCHPLVLLIAAIKVFCFGFFLFCFVFSLREEFSTEVAGMRQSSFGNWICKQESE